MGGRGRVRGGGSGRGNSKKYLKWGGVCVCGGGEGSLRNPFKNILKHGTGKGKSCL